jgi:membrane protein DedA with SNARE-associated domain
VNLFSGGMAATFATYGYVGLFLIIFLEELGVPIPMPGHGVFLFAGYLASQGSMQLAWVIVIGIAAAVSGASILYAIARIGGRPLMRKTLRWVSLGDGPFDRAELEFKRRGRLFVPVTRLMPGMRIYGSALSGACLMPYRQFVVATLAASIVWVVSMSYAGNMLEGNSGFLAPLFPLFGGLGIAYLVVPGVVKSIRARLAPRLIPMPVPVEPL